MVRHLLKITTKNIYNEKKSNPWTNEQAYGWSDAWRNSALRKSPTNLSVETPVLSTLCMYTSSWHTGLDDEFVFIDNFVYDWVFTVCIPNIYRGPQECNENGRRLWRVNIYWNKVAVDTELACRAEIGDSCRGITLKLIIKHN